MKKSKPDRRPKKPAPGLAGKPLLAGSGLKYIAAAPGVQPLLVHVLHDSADHLIQLIQEGLPVTELEALRSGLDLPMETFLSKIGISKATLHRRKSKGLLRRDESDRVVRFAKLLSRAIDVFENQDSARAWLRSPQVGLGGAVPLDYARTEVGAREVEDLLGRIDHSVYS